MSESVFARARRTLDVGQLVGVAARAGKWTLLKGKKHPCPICQGHDCFSFRRTGFRCHATGERGDAIEFAARIWGLTPFEAACRHLGLDAEAERKSYAATQTPRDEKRKPAAIPRAAPARDTYDQDVEAVIDRIVMQLIPARGTLVDCYLGSRAIPPRFSERALFCADAPYDIGAAFGRGRSFPAMVFFVERDGARTGGLHVTYLRPDGAGKIDTLRDGEKQKKMWGPQLDRHGKPGGILIAKPEPGALLCVAEGFENAASLAAVAGHGAGAWAAGSLDRFQGGMAHGHWGGVDWRWPRPDPERPAATMKHDGPVLLGVDSDMRELVLQKGTPWRQTISAARRAAVSGVLAAHWWRDRGVSDVRVLTPAPGKDANDVLRERAA